MSRKMTCMACQRDFLDEDYCEFDGTRLRPRAEQEPVAAPTQARAAGKPQELGTRGSARDEPEKGAPGNARAGGARPTMDHIRAIFGAGRDRPADLRQVPANDLPQELSAWRRSPENTPWKTDGIECVPISHPELGSAVLRWHTSGSQTSDTTYQMLQRAILTFLPSVFASGTCSKGDYEVISWRGNEIGFETWIASNGGAESATWFLRRSIEILAGLTKLGVIPRWLSPASFALRDDRLILVELSNLAPLGQDAETFVPSIGRVKPEYLALETFTRKCWTDRSALYSLGVIAAELARGFAPSHESTSNGQVDFGAIGDTTLRKALQGLLYPNHALRWGLDEMNAWACGQSASVPDWSRLQSGASETAFVFAGRNFHLAADLASPLLEDLDVSAQRLDELLDWMRTNPALREKVSDIRLHRNDGRSVDWQLLRIAALLDPTAPRHWRGVSLDIRFARSNLVELGQRASHGDPHAKALVARLRQIDLSEVYKGIGT